MPKAITEIKQPLDIEWRLGPNGDLHRFRNHHQAVAWLQAIEAGLEEVSKAAENSYFNPVNRNDAIATVVSRLQGVRVGISDSLESQQTAAAALRSENFSGVPIPSTPQFDQLRAIATTFGNVTAYRYMQMANKNAAPAIKDVDTTAALARGILSIALDSETVTSLSSELTALAKKARNLKSQVGETEAELKRAVEASSELEAAVKTAKEQHDTLNGTLDSYLAGEKQRVETEVTDFLKEAESRINAHTEVQGAIDHWLERQAEHREKADKWLGIVQWGFVGLGLVLLILVFIGAQPGQVNFDAALLVRLATGGSLIGTIAWALRLAVKSWINETHLQQDAEERIAFLKCWISSELSNRDHNDGARAIVFGAVFRPRSSAILSTEGIQGNKVELRNAFGPAAASDQ